MRKLSRALVLSAVSLLAASCTLAADVRVVGSLTRELSLKPGGKAEGTILLHNDSDAAQDVRIYQTDYLFYADGRNLYGDPGNDPRSNARWITFTPRQVSVPPRGTSAAYYVIQAPADAALSGTYWSMLMVEPLAEGALDPPVAEKGRVAIGVRTVLRYGIQMVTHTGEGAKRELRFLDQQLVKKDGKRFLQMDLESTGEGSLTPLVWVEVYNAQGGSLGRFEAGRLRLYPGCSGRFRADLSDLPAGEYSALIVADDGDENVFGTRRTLQVD
jgi:hypothetical protein